MDCSVISSSKSLSSNLALQENQKTSVHTCSWRSSGRERRGADAPNIAPRGL